MLLKLPEVRFRTLHQQVHAGLMHNVCTSSKRADNIEKADAKQHGFPRQPTRNIEGIAKLFLKFQ